MPENSSVDYYACSLEICPLPLKEVELNKRDMLFFVQRKPYSKEELQNVTISGPYGYDFSKLPYDEKEIRKQSALTFLRNFTNEIMQIKKSVNRKKTPSPSMIPTNPYSPSSV
jgi:hypothetical protein